jgi:hypothetical protein
MKTVLLAATLLGLASQAHAQSWVYPLHQSNHANRISSTMQDPEELKQMVITDLGAAPLPSAHITGGPLGDGPGVLGLPSLGDIIGSADSLIALGQKLWGIIDGSKAAARLELGTPASVLPATAQDPATAFASMDSWSTPAAHRYHVAFQNWRGADAISFDYLVSYQYGGQLNGAGKYLTGILVSAQNLYVGMLWEIDAKSTLLNISNVGTHDAPVAGAQFQISWSVKRRALGSEYDGSQVLFLKGNGESTVIDDKQTPAPTDGGNPDSSGGEGTLP